MIIIPLSPSVFSSLPSLPSVVFVDEEDVGDWDKYGKTCLTKSTVPTRLMSITNLNFSSGSGWFLRSRIKPGFPMPAAVITPASGARVSLVIHERVEVIEVVIWVVEVTSVGKNLIREGEEDLEMRASARVEFRSKMAM